MPRIRSIKPEIWSDEALGACPIGARLLYIGLITQADDEGRFRAAPALIRGAVFPYDAIGAAKIAAWIEQLHQADLVQLYEVKGEQYGVFPTWQKHQKIDRPTPSKLPAEPKPRARRGLVEGSSADLGREGKGSRKGSGSISSAASADTRMFDQIFERWIAQPALIQHQSPKPAMQKAAQQVLADWPLDQVLEAIELYGTVIASEQHYFSYRWTLDEFLVRGLGKFAAEAGPLARYFGPAPSTNGAQRPASPERDPAASRLRLVEKCRREYELRRDQLGAVTAREDVLGMFSDDVVSAALS